MGMTSNSSSVEEVEHQMLLDEVVFLYTLLRKAKEFLTQGLMREQTKRRRKKKIPPIAPCSPSVASIKAEDSGYSDSVLDVRMVVEGGWKYAAAGGVSAYWNRVRKACFYTAFFMAALIPLAAYSQARCCENVNTYNSWIKYEYVNGPPP